MVRLAIAILFGWLPAVAEAQIHRPASDRTLAAIAARIHQRTGVDPRSCGNWFALPAEELPALPRRLRESISCARRTAAAGEPVWFVVGGHSIDSWVAEGLLAPANGPIEHFSYDSDPGGGGDISRRAYFNSRRCVGASLYRYSSGALAVECLNDPWRLAVHAVVVGLSAVSLGIAVLLADME